MNRSIIPVYKKKNKNPQIIINQNSRISHINEVLGLPG